MTEVRTQVEKVASQAQETVQRTVLTSVGAVLVARDGIVEVRGRYSTPKKAERELQKLERRGRSAVNRLEREVKKTRTRVERELRQRRTRVERDVKGLRARRRACRSPARASAPTSSSPSASRTSSQTGVTGRHAAGRERPASASPTVALAPPHDSSASPRRAPRTGGPSPSSAAASRSAFATMGRMPSRDEILEALSAVIDPELRQHIVELGMVRSIDDRRRRRRSPSRSR